MNSVDPDQTPQSPISDRIIYCLPVFETPTDSKMDLFKFYYKYGKKVRCPNIYGKWVSRLMGEC